LLNVAFFSVAQEDGGSVAATGQKIKALGAGSQTNIMQQRLETKPVNHSRNKVVVI